MGEEALAPRERAETRRERWIHLGFVMIVVALVLALRATATPLLLLLPPHLVTGASTASPLQTRT